MNRQEHAEKEIQWLNELLAKVDQRIDNMYERISKVPFGLRYRISADIFLEEDDIIEQLTDMKNVFEGILKALSVHPRDIQAFVLDPIEQRLSHVQQIAELV